MKAHPKGFWPTVTTLVAASAAVGLWLVISNPAVSRELPEDDGSTLVTLDQLQVGDCLKGFGNAKKNVSEVRVIPCKKPHKFQIFAIENLELAEYGVGPMDKAADQICMKRFKKFTGISYDDSDLVFGYLVPTEDGWDLGDREVTCYLSMYNHKKLKGTAKGKKI